MKLKKALAVVLACVMTIGLAGCGSKDNNANSSSNTGSNNANILSGTVVITGSTSVDKIITDMIDEFEALNPRVRVNYTGTGSSAGISDSIAGTNTLGVSSRDLKDEEKSDKIHTAVFAYDGIAIVVNPSNPVKDITLETLAKIYSGQIKNWSELGGNDAEIQIISREGSSGTREAFEDLIGLEDAGGLSENATVVEGNGNAQTSVANNKNAIGYVSFSYIDKTVKELTVGGVEPTAENAKAGTYSLSRPFLFVYNDKTITPEAKAFIEYAQGPDGQGYVEEHGGIKLN